RCTSWWSPSGAFARSAWSSASETGRAARGAAGGRARRRPAGGVHGRAFGVGRAVSAGALEPHLPGARRRSRGRAAAAAVRIEGEVRARHGPRGENPDQAAPVVSARAEGGLDLRRSVGAGLAVLSDGAAAGRDPARAGAEGRRALARSG